MKNKLRSILLLILLSGCTNIPQDIRVVAMSGPQKIEKGIASNLQNQFRIPGRDDIRYFIGKSARRSILKQSTFRDNEQMQLKETYGKLREVDCAIVASKSDGDVYLKFQTSKVNKWEYKNEVVFYGFEGEFFTLGEQDPNEIQAYKTTVHEENDNILKFSRSVKAALSLGTEKMDVEILSVKGNFSVKVKHTQKGGIALSFNQESSDQKSWDCKGLKSVSKEDYKKVVDSIQFEILI